MADAEPSTHETRSERRPQPKPKGQRIPSWQFVVYEFHTNFISFGFFLVYQTHPMTPRNEAMGWRTSTSSLRPDDELDEVLDSSALAPSSSI
jgi:hypothetical protein